ncbi:MAG: hypothetical protein FJX59_10515 [Alphaproteobacteria bacterium]|nr:hypothetical protein [Alphaproteobacteria bacterium]
MDDAPSGLGWSDFVAAAVAIGIATVAAPPAHAAGDVVGPQPAPEAPSPSPPLLPDLSLPSDAASRTSAVDYAIVTQPVALRFAPSVDGQTGAQPSIVVRNDHWNLVDLDGVARLSAFSKGTLTAEDAVLARTPAAMPRQTGTGFGFVTDTPMYVGATLRTDRSIYDFEIDRFRGARWTTSLFVGTSTSFGPIYVGTYKEPDRSRATYLYLGRWF